MNNYQKAAEYLKDSYGLDPNDVDLPEDADIAWVDWYAEKRGLIKLGESETSLEGAIHILSSAVGRDNACAAVPKKYDLDVEFERRRGCAPGDPDNF